MSIKTFDSWSREVYESVHATGLADFEAWYLLKEDTVSDALGTTDNSRPDPKVGWDPAIIARVEAMPDQEVLSKAETIVNLCRLKIFENLAWFRAYWDAMPPQPVFRAGGTLSGKIGTMSTSGSAIYYCPRFVVYTFEFAKAHMEGVSEGGSRQAQQLMRKGSKWYNDYATFVLVHEILHNSLKHFTRDTLQGVRSSLVSRGEIQQLWNIAFDYEINRILKQMLGDTLEIFPGGVDHEAGRFKAPEGEEDFFAKSTAERIFYRLLRELERKRMTQHNQDNQQQNQPGDLGIAIGDIVEVKSEPGKYRRVINIDVDESDPSNSRVDLEDISPEELPQEVNTGYTGMEDSTEDFIDDLESNFGEDLDLEDL